MTSAAPFKPQTVSAILARGVIALAKTSDSARADAHILLAHALGRDREWLVANAEGFLNRPQVEKYQSYIDRRAAGTPIAYILGSAWFYGREFTVNDHVLIPRPETEHLVDEAVGFLRSRVNPNLPKALLTVLDVGVGSGAIGCSIAAEVPNAAVEGTDASPAAIKVAEHNARRLNVHARCKFHLGDLAGPVTDRRYDVLVANLPYIPSADVPVAPDPVGFEPRQALDGGPDGLNHYRRLLVGAARLMRPSGLLLLEAAAPTMDGLEALARAAFPTGSVEVRSDYGGSPRYVKVKAS
jgi:release factor glutamine methyltransferase